jgi:hypothetical protein
MFSSGSQAIQLKSVGWLPKNTVLQIFLSKFLNVYGYPEMDANSLSFAVDHSRSKKQQAESLVIRPMRRMREGLKGNWRGWSLFYVPDKPAGA